MAFVNLAVITGGTRGLGRSVALRLQNTGYQVATIHRRIVPNPVGTSYLCDVRDQPGLHDTFRRIERDFGMIATLICCAGVYHPYAPFAQEPWSTWHRILDTNVHGTLAACLAVLPGMQQRRHGRIITISGAGIGGPASPYMAAYAASKAAVVQFTESLAVELDGTGITINAVAPGKIENPEQMTRAVDLIESLLSTTISGKLISTRDDNITDHPPNTFTLRRVIP